MAKSLMQMAIAALLAGGCSLGTQDAPEPPPPERPTPPPFRWITAEPDCSGQLRRGEWLVCETPSLRTAHQSLAAAWERRRLNADRPTIHMLQLQQRALFSERALCADLACVANAYQRYLRVPTPIATPKPAPTTRPVANARPHKPRDQRASTPPPHWSPNRRPGQQSCAAELGGSASAYLVRQCRVVAGNHNRACTADRSCDDLRERIDRGCQSSHRPPGFCSEETAAR